MDEYDDGNAGLLKRVSDDGSNELDFGLGGMTQQSAQSYYDKLKTAQEAWQSKAAEAMTPEINYWKAQTEALKNLRMGPSRTEQLFQLSAALAQPTRYRGFGATLENVMPFLAAQEKAKRDAQMQQMELANKYMPEILQAQREQRKIALGAAPQDPQEFMQKYLLEAQKEEARRNEPLVIKNADGTVTVIRRGALTSGATSQAQPSATPAVSAPQDKDIPTISTEQEYNDLEFGDPYIDAQTGEIKKKT